MQTIRIVLQISILYLLYWIGTWIQAKLHLPIPGSIIGMLLLFGLLLTNLVKSEWINKGSDLLIRHMPLLFLPVIVGIINYFELFSGKGILLLVIIAISTALVMISSGLVSQWVWKRMEHTND